MWNHITIAVLVLAGLISGACTPNDTDEKSPQMTTGELVQAVLAGEVALEEITPENFPRAIASKEWILTLATHEGDLDTVPEFVRNFSDEKILSGEYETERGTHPHGNFCKLAREDTILNILRNNKVEQWQKDQLVNACYPFRLTVEMQVAYLEAGGSKIFLKFDHEVREGIIPRELVVNAVEKDPRNLKNIPGIYEVVGDDVLANLISNGMFDMSSAVLIRLHGSRPGLIEKAVREHETTRDLPREVLVANNCRVARIGLQYTDWAPEYCWLVWEGLPPEVGEKLVRLANNSN